MNRIAVAALLAINLASQPAAAVDMTSSALSYVNEHVRPWLSTPQVIAALGRANADNGQLTAEQILELDTRWRAEVGTDSALIGGILNNAVSQTLRDQSAATEGMVTEVILMDAQGLNVAISEVTSDYWQGDEAKHQETFLVGPQAVHVSEVEFDESTQTYSIQVSITLVDPATGQAIGAATVGLNAEAL